MKIPLFRREARIPSGRTIKKGSDGDGKKNAWILPVIIAGASILIGAGVTTAIVMLMKKKKKAV